MTTNPAVTVSAPGKVLLAGGYLVLESPNTGLVVAADKRFYCTVLKKGHASKSSITVHSPQFHSDWTYECEIQKEKEDELALLASKDNQSENVFVEKTLRVVLGYLWQSGAAFHNGKIPSLDITIRADNDFYSVLTHLRERNWNSTPQEVAKLPKFLPCPVRDGKPIIHKTGLGSSAALVTSLVGALLQSFGAIDLPKTRDPNNSQGEESLRIAHNLAQISHCHAQGKVGSGFDVSAGIYSSHIYERFPKCLLPDLLSSLERCPHIVTKSTAETLTHIVHTKWSGGIVNRFSFPRCLNLMLADVCGGSESPSMARKVLAWKNKNKDEPYWQNLARINNDIVTLFETLSQSTAMQTHAETLAQFTAEQWKQANSDAIYQQLVDQLLELRQLFASARDNLKAMGDASGVPIEPDEQTMLADATMKLPGVVTAVVPGAGGYDALACLHIQTDSVKNSIGKSWAEWISKGNRTSVCPLAVQSANYGQGLCQVTDFDELLKN